MNDEASHVFLREVPDLRHNQTGIYVGHSVIEFLSDNTNSSSFVVKLVIENLFKIQSKFTSNIN